LALSSIPAPKLRNGVFDYQEDETTWCEAFEDLLLASQGRPMAIHQILLPELRADRRSSAMNEDADSEWTKALYGNHWIRRLHDYGLLTREPPSNSFLQSPIRMRFPKINADWKESRLVSSKLPSFRKTEQDLYESMEDGEGHGIEGDIWDDEDYGVDEDDGIEGDVWDEFDDKLPDILELMEGLLSGPSLPWNIGPALGALCKEADIEPLKRLAQEPEDEDEDIRESVSGKKPDSSERTFGNVVNTRKSTSTQTERIPGQVRQTNGTTKSVWSGQGGEEQLESRTPPASDRVVSTTTSTEQTTDETGGVHTTVRIEKVYADGRISITETSKTQVSPVDKRHMQRASDEECDCQSCSDRRQSLESPAQRMQREQNELKNQKDKKSKGWFWN
jgi:hypothetical protein